MSIESETSLWNKFFKLLKNPKEEKHKLYPFIKSVKTNFTRKIYKFFGIDIMSKPYYNQDVLLSYINKKKGFFVIAGGYNGFSYDPTYYYEKIKKWTGVIIEPLPIYKKCQKIRNKSKVYNYALVPFNFKKKFVTLAFCKAMTVMKDNFDGYSYWVKHGEKIQNMKAIETTAEAKTLQSILDDFFSKNKARKIDLLVLDTEGTELGAMKGLDFKKYSPEYILVEIHTKEGNERKIEIENYLNKNNYKLIEKIFPDDFLFRINE